MDIISHGLIGSLIGMSDKNRTTKTILQNAFFTILPDVSQLFYYFFLGHLKDRPFNWPLDSDWNNFRGEFPYADLLWDIPHSLFFVALFIIPLIRYFKLSNFLILSYLSHILIDIPTHTGEWGVKFLFPFQFQVSGLNDAWAWGIDNLAIAWSILIIINLGFFTFLQPKNPSS